MTASGKRRVNSSTSPAAHASSDSPTSTKPASTENCPTGQVGWRASRTCVSSASCTRQITAGSVLGYSSYPPRRQKHPSRRRGVRWGCCRACRSGRARARRPGRHRCHRAPRGSPAGRASAPPRGDPPAPRRTPSRRWRPPRRATPRWQAAPRPSPPPAAAQARRGPAPGFRKPGSSSSTVLCPGRQRGADDDHPTEMRAGSPVRSRDAAGSRVVLQAGARGVMEPHVDPVCCRGRVAQRSQPRH